MSSLVGQKLIDVLGIDSDHCGDYKVHFATYSEEEDHLSTPYEAFKNDREEWQKWNSSSPVLPVGNQFDRKYILSMAQYDFDGNDKHTWLFCCVYQVLDSWREGTGDAAIWRHKVEIVDLGKTHGGRLLVKAPPRKVHRVVRINLDDDLSEKQRGEVSDSSSGAHLHDHLIVKEVLDPPHVDWDL